MIDISKLNYKVIVFTEKGLQLNVTDAVKKVNWEEQENQLAAKVTFEMYNARYNGSLLSSLVKLNCKVGVIANWGAGNKVVAYANIKEAMRETSKSDEIFQIVAYDNLFDMQKSQDDAYYPAGKTTKSILNAICSKWGITISKYSGPVATHGKVLEKSQYLGDIIRKVLKEAKEKGAGKGLIRCTEGKVEIVGIAQNTDVYRLDGSNTQSSRHKVTICNMVTRVKIVSSEKTEGLPKVEAVVNGKTQYGILQRIVTHSSSDDLSDAKTEANEILKENGEPEETSTVVAPDVPLMRKGDLVSLNAGALVGNFVVKSITHNVDTRKMTLQVVKFNEKDLAKEKKKIRNLKYGDTGDDVLELQRKLQSIGYYLDGALDGWFGAITDRAVRQFQAAWGIYVDGVVGPVTREALDKAIAQGYYRKKSFKVGDTVTFYGGYHYVSSWPGEKGYKVRGSGPARIYLGPDCAGNGKAHPWCLITTNASKCNVYGWVDEGTFG